MKVAEGGQYELGKPSPGAGGVSAGPEMGRPSSPAPKPQLQGDAGCHDGGAR